MMSEHCTTHPYAPAVSVSRFDDRSPICQLCRDWENMGGHRGRLEDYERALREGR
jgi:hypothetical protein